MSLCSTNITEQSRTRDPKQTGQVLANAVIVRGDCTKLHSCKTLWQRRDSKKYQGRHSREVSTQGLELVLDEEGNDLGEGDLLLLHVGEAGHLLALDEGGTVGALDILEHAGTVTDCSDRLAGCGGGLENLDRGRVVDKVPEASVAAGNEPACAWSACRWRACTDGKVVDGMV